MPDVAVKSGGFGEQLWLPLNQHLDAQVAVTKSSILSEIGLKTTLKAA